MLHIKHVNLSRGYRGGERQVEMLIKALSEKNVKQTLVCRRESVLPGNLQRVRNLEITTIGKPFVLSLVKLRGADIIHGHENHGARLGALAWPLFSIPFLFTRRVPNPISKNTFNRYIYRNASSVVCLSEAINEVVNKTFKNVNTTIIPDMSSDLDASDENVQRIKKRFKGKVLIGHVGALVKRCKGQHLVIEMARKLLNERPELHFLFLGRGEDEDLLKEQAKGLTNITFEGFKENVGDYLSAIDIFLFPSLMEGFGSVLLDTMKFKTPIVASAIGGIPEFIKDRINGLLFEMGNVAAMKEALLALIDDKGLQEKVSLGAFETVKKYSPEIIAESYLQLYKKLLKSK